MERSVSPQGTAADQRQPSLPRRVNKRAVSRGALTAATTALLGCAGSLPSARAAGAAVSGAPSGPRPTGARALRRSNWSTRGHGSEYRSLLDVAGQQRRGLSSLSRAWGVAQSTRGGAFSRRGGNGPAAAVPAAGMGGDEGEEAREDVVSGEGGGGGGGDDADAEAASGQGSDEVSSRNDVVRTTAYHTAICVWIVPLPVWIILLRLLMWIILLCCCCCCGSVNLVLYRTPSHALHRAVVAVS